MKNKIKLLKKQLNKKIEKKIYSLLLLLISYYIFNNFEKTFGCLEPLICLLVINLVF